jgi:AcrR family transcriptional regulator
MRKNRKAKKNKKTANRGRPPRKDERLNDLVMKAAALFYKKGYSNTTTREIAEAAGISKGLLYYYINTKEDFLDLFIERLRQSFGGYNRKILDELPFTSAATAICRAIKEVILGMDELQDMLLFWYRECGYMPRDRLRRITEQEIMTVTFFEDIIKAGCDRGEFNVKDVHLAAYQIHALCINWVLKRWDFKKRYSAEQYITEVQKSTLAILGCR